MTTFKHPQSLGAELQAKTSFGDLQKFSLKHYFLCSVIFCAMFSGASNAQVTFDNVTSTVGPFHKGESWGAAWVDFNGDYYPDLGINNHRHRHSLWINQGGQNFVERILQIDRDRVFTTDSELNQDSHGTTYADVDNDGDQDMLGARSSAGGRAQLLLNEQGVRFVDAADAVLTSKGKAGRMGSFYDYNQDGLLDLFYGSSSTSGNRVFRNDGSSFTDVTPSTYQNDCERIHYHQFSSIDNDTSGLQNLDIACVSEGNFPEALFDASGGTSNFIDITSIIPNTSNTVDTVFADFDNDGDNDVFVLKGSTRRSGASLVAPDKIESMFVTGSLTGDKSFRFESTGSVTITDFDRARDNTPLSHLRIGSGDNIIPSLPFTLDKNSAFAQGISSNTSTGAYIGYDTSESKWKVRYRSTSNEAYYTILEGTGLTEPADLELANRDLPLTPAMLKNSGAAFAPVFNIGLDPVNCSSVAAGDFDNDMDIDLYLACAGGVENYVNIIYLNDGTGNFTAATAHGAEGIIGKGLDAGAGIAESVIVADYDVDGRLDLFTTNGAALVPVYDGGPDELFKNTTINSNNWVEFDLIGMFVNRDATGAKVTATTGGVTQIREQNGGYHRWSQNDRRIHFGLGLNQTVDITVDWSDGSQDSYVGVASNSLYELTQGQSLQQVVPGAYSPDPTPQAGDECSNQGQAYNTELDQGVFLYKDCGSGQWSLRVIAGNSEQSINFTGHILSGEPIVNVTEFDLEGSDSVTVTDRRIDFSLSVLGTGEDGFDFDLVNTSGACIQSDNLENIVLGEQHFFAPAQLDLKQIGQCDLLPDGSLDVPPTITISVTTPPFIIPGDGGNSTQIVDLSGTGLQIDDVVNVSGLLADGDLNSSSETFSLSLNGGEFEANNVTTGEQCVGSLLPITSPINDSVTVIDIGSGVPGIQIFGSTTSAVNADCDDVQYILTISATTIDTDNSTLACGEPSYSPSSEAGLFVWRDCAGTDNWFIRATAGGGAATSYEGVLTTDTQFNSVAEYSFEGIDYSELSNLDKQLNFLMRMAGGGQDGLEVAMPVDSDLCLALEDVNQIIYAGSAKTPFLSPVNLQNPGDSCIAGPPQISVADLTVLEDVGSAAVTVSLNQISGQLVSVSYSTIDGTALAGQDYTAVSGVVEFQPGETDKMVLIPIMQDTELESVEDFTLVLSGAVNADLLDGIGVISIEDDETNACGEPSYSPSTDAGIFLWKDCGNTENWKMRATAGGGAAITYTGIVTSEAAISSVTPFSFEGIDSFELSNSDQQLDFLMKMGNAGVDGLEFSVQPGVSCFDIDAPTNQQVVVGASNAILSPPFDISSLDSCTIAGLPRLSVADLSVAENVAGGTLDVVVTLSAVAALDVTVDVVTGDISAKEPGDYTAVTTTATIIAGNTSVNVPVTIVDDAANESDETFSVTLSNPSANAELALGGDIATITINDDEMPQLSIADLSVAENVAGGTLDVVVALSAVAALDVTVNLSTSDDTAFAPGDYAAVATTATIIAGNTSVNVPISIVDDVLNEGDETFTLTLSNPSANAELAAGSDIATITINDDDDVDVNTDACGEPSFSSGSEKGLFVWKDCAGTGDWFMRATAGGGVATTYDGIMLADTQFTAVTEFSFEGIDNFQLSNADMQLDFEVKMTNSGVDGLDLSLGSPSELCLTLAASDQTIYIGSAKIAYSSSSPLNLLDPGYTCGAPQISVADSIVVEDVAGGMIDVVVSLDKTSGQLVRVSYATADGSAVDGQDYSAVSGFVDFLAGETSKTVLIPILQDTQVELLEDFSLNLSNPVNAQIADPSGVITIQDDD